MLMKKFQTVLMMLLLASGAAAGLMPTASAQQATDAQVTDDVGDVHVYAGTKGEPGVPVDAASVPSEISSQGDLTSLRIFDESATSISFEVGVDSFGRTNTREPSQINLFVCFQYSVTGNTYRFQWSFGYPNAPQPEATVYPAPPVAGTLEMLASGDCQVHDQFPRDSYSQLIMPGQFDLNMEDSTLQWTVERRLIEKLNPTYYSDGTTDPVPMAGDSFTGLKAVAITKAGNSFLGYDETSTMDYPFNIDTGNEQLKVLIRGSFYGARGLDVGFDTPVFGVEKGSYQTVPVTLENTLDAPVEPNITVEVIQGDATKWDIRTLSSIPVPAMADGEPGRTTITLIVNSAATVDHKEMVRVVVSAKDPDHPYLGAQAVDIIAVSPPRQGTTDLFFHAAGNVCSTNNRWINTLKDDSTGKLTEIGFRSCDPQSGAAGQIRTDTAGYLFRPDVPFARDLWLSSQDDASATLMLRSTFKPNAAAPETPTDTIADVTVQVLSGSTVIGEGTTRATITSSQSAVKVPIDIPGQILGGSEREITNDRGLGIRVMVEALEREFEVGGCIQEACVPEDQQNLPGTGGRVMMALGQASKVSLPIAKSERAGEVFNITKSGALITMRLADIEAQRTLYTNPGKIVVFNVSVRNEGVNVDTAVVSAELNQTGWKAEILPQVNFKLKSGVAREFLLRVTAPADGREGQELLIRLTATSKVDPEMHVTLPLKVHLTTGELFEDHEVDPDLEKVDTAESPVASFAYVFAVLALIGVALRRRR